MADDSNDVRLSLRLPADLAAQIRRLAASNDRSLNGEIIRAIRAHLAGQPRSPAAPHHSTARKDDAAQ